MVIKVTNLPYSVVCPRWAHAKALKDKLRGFHYCVVPQPCVACKRRLQELKQDEEVDHCQDMLSPDHMRVIVMKHLDRLSTESEGVCTQPSIFVFQTSESQRICFTPSCFGLCQPMASGDLPHLKAASIYLSSWTWMVNIGNLQLFNSK